MKKLDYETMKNFDQTLRECSPEASSQVITMARNAFLRRYGSYSVSPTIALAITLPEELMMIRNAGKKCQDVYANAQMSIRPAFEKPVKDILDLKYALYDAAEEYVKKIRKIGTKWLCGIDTTVLQCVQLGMTNKKKFEKVAAPYLINIGHYLFHTEMEIMETAYSAIAKELHPNIENPQTYIVKYLDESFEEIFTGVSPVKGRDNLMAKIRKDGYGVALSGRFYGKSGKKLTPIRIIYAAKKKEENENET